MTESVLHLILYHTAPMYIYGYYIGIRRSSAFTISITVYTFRDSIQIYKMQLGIYYGIQYDVVYVYNVLCVYNHYSIELRFYRINIHLLKFRMVLNL